jgi:hypothetical protein
MPHMDDIPESEDEPIVEPTTQLVRTTSIRRKASLDPPPAMVHVEEVLPGIEPTTTKDLIATSSAPVALLLLEDVHITIKDGTSILQGVWGAIYLQVHPGYFRGKGEVLYLKVEGREAVRIELDDCTTPTSMVEVYTDERAVPLHAPPVAAKYFEGGIIAWDTNPAFAVFNLSFCTASGDVTHAIRAGELVEPDAKAFDARGDSLIGLRAQFEAFPLRPMSSVQMGLYMDAACTIHTSPIGGMYVHVEGTSTME